MGSRPQVRLIIFGRYPRPWTAKTRLIPVLGAFGAAELQRLLAEKAWQTARRASALLGVVPEFCAQGGSPRQMERWLGKTGTFTRQTNGDLGRKMERAFAAAFARDDGRVLLAGTDVPEMRVGHIQAALAALADHELVLGPTLDGGYWLIGLSRPADLFQRVPWGTAAVLDQTLRLASRLRLRTFCLPPLRDLDTPADLGWEKTQETPPPYISVVIPAFNEARRIGRTVALARQTETEVLVVDGGSSDHTGHLAADAGARVLKSARGRAVQQNLGARAARGRVLLFLHADTDLPARYGEAVFDAFLDPGVSMGAFRFATDSPRPGMRLVEAMVNLRSRFLRLPYGDQGLFVRQRDFTRWGGFPEAPIAEDLLLVQRAGKEGRIAILRQAAVTSARRWQRLGILRTTFVNQMILLGCMLGWPPGKMARWYGRGPGSPKGGPES